jgi:hypothetical protein
MPTYTLPNTQTGGSQQISANSLADAESQAQATGTWSPAAGTYGSNSVGAYTPGSTPSSPAGPQATVNAASSLGTGINSLLGAIASGNKQAFDEAVRQFNLSFGLDQDKLKESARQFDAENAIAAAGLTGTYNGQQTLQGQQQGFNQAQAIAQMTGYWNPNAPGTWTSPGAAGTALSGGNLSWNQVSQQLQAAAGANYNDAAAKAMYQQLTGANPSAFNGGAAATLTPAQIGQIYAAGGAPSPTAAAGGAASQGQMTTAYQQQLYNEQLAAINAAAQLQANPFRQQQVIGQLGRILGGQGVAGFSAPNTVAGVGTQGGNTQGGMGYMSQLIDDIQGGSGGTNSTGVDSVLAGIPTPNRINSADFLRSAPSTQNMILQGMQEKYGLDPTDSLQQIKNTLPAFQAPSTFGTIRG